MYPLLKKNLDLIAYGIITAIFIGIAVMLFLPQSSKKDYTVFEIPKGQSFLSTVAKLHEESLVPHNYLFLSYSVITFQYHFKAGRYVIPDNISIAALVRMFHKGATNDDIVIRIPEGSNVNDIDKIIARTGLLPAQAFLNANAVVYEGYMLPDTYRFLPGTKVSDIITTLTNNFTKKTKAEFNDLSIDKNAVIVASILEKEEATDTDMKIVAGIIYRRLKLGMPLQIDATVAYGACRPYFDRGQYCEPSKVPVATYIRRVSPYNTYKNKSLPPDPISNPGLRALNAALHPRNTDYLFYLNTSDGTAVYSKTDTEHVRAVQKYLR